MAYKNTVKDYSQMIGFLTRDKTTDVPGSMAHGLRTGLYDGGRAGFDNGGQTMVEQAKELGISKSALRKPFAPEIEEKIIKLHQVDKMGAEAIANELGLPRSSVGKRITALKKEGKIKDVPYAERKLENFDVEGVSKNAEGGRIGLFMGGGLKAGKGLLRNMLNFMAEKATHGKKGSEMLQLVNPKQLDKYLNDPATMGKVSPEAPAGIPEIINAKKKEMTEDRS
jgi:hypothetical protein